MAFRQQETIRIGRFAPGHAYGGAIYNFSCQMGFDSNSTQLSINVVSNNGLYNITKNDQYDTNK